MVFSMLSLDAIAEESNETALMNMASQALIVEGLIAANSGLAAHHPEGWGWTMTVVLPLCAAN